MLLSEDIFRNSNAPVAVAVVYSWTIPKHDDGVMFMYITELTWGHNQLHTSWYHFLDQGGLISASPQIVLWRWFLNCCNMFLKHAPQRTQSGFFFFFLFQIFLLDKCVFFSLKEKKKKMKLSCSLWCNCYCF